MKMYLHIVTVFLALFLVADSASSTETTNKKPLCHSCVVVANALKNVNKIANVKNGVKTVCNKVMKNELTCTNVINAASLYLTITPANTLCVEATLCSASSLLPDLGALGNLIPTALPISIPNLNLPIPSISLPTALPTLSNVGDIASGVVGTLGKSLPIPISIPTALPSISVPNVADITSGVVGTISKNLPIPSHPTDLPSISIPKVGDITSGVVGTISKNLPIPSISIPTALPSLSIPSIGGLTSGVVGTLGKIPSVSTSGLGALSGGFLTRNTRQADFGFNKEEQDALNQIIKFFQNGQHK